MTNSVKERKSGYFFVSNFVTRTCPVQYLIALDMGFVDYWKIHVSRAIVVSRTVSWSMADKKYQKYDFIYSSAPSLDRERWGAFVAFRAHELSCCTVPPALLRFVLFVLYIFSISLVHRIPNAVALDMELCRSPRRNALKLKKRHPARMRSGHRVLYNCPERLYPSTYI